MTEKILSVGIDLGTSTTQLVLSELFIENMASAFSIPRIVISDKKVIYKSDIRFTPILADNLIDVEEIKQFDLVFCLGVAEHVEDLLYFLKGLKRKVKSGGVCYLEVPHNLLYSKGPETYRRLTTRSKQIEWHLPRKRWERIILASGFEIVKSYTGLNATWEYIWVLK